MILDTRPSRLWTRTANQTHAHASEDDLRERIVACLSSQMRTAPRWFLSWTMSSADGAYPLRDRLQVRHTTSPTKAQPGPYGLRKKFGTAAPANLASRLARRIRSANSGASSRPSGTVGVGDCRVCTRGRVQAHGCDFDASMRALDSGLRALTPRTIRSMSLR
jgi:hypothetical protein